MIIAANLKMNLKRKDLQHYKETLQTQLSLLNSVDAVIFPNMACLLDSSYFQDIPLTQGAQNAYPAKNGAYTGEIGSEILEELGIRTILIGHSERRELGDNQEFCLAKFTYYQELGFRIFYCIGEPLHIRKKGLSAVMDFLQTQISGIDLHYPSLVIAYEPIWAIGATQPASIEEISATHLNLKNLFRNINPTRDIPLLYGGSVKADNAREISQINGVDGMLIGSGALNPQNFLHIIKETLE
ncbi:triose-phosphate isomerase [Helicobacter monodelphidis]|uniref:triose-phosphate isomerase n=1 Tax=Helicobacter sp. 15-1451 TaxID=2004995 RepID=UPI000DCB7333|nr:triose-phosphate isomerase [Helicobacter sp. 15-1451]RAX58597.1 triose-phosphate isomerase [Helicobacter sp. 15-1451]